MSMVPSELRELFNEHDHVFALREYRMRCIAHRLKKFGFERHLNLMPPNDLMLLAFFMHGHQRAALMNEAAERLGLNAKVGVA